MALVTQFDTPGSLRDAPDGSPFYRAWHRKVAGLIKSATRLSGSGEYVDPSRWPISPVARRSYTWTGFPRPHLTGEFRDDREGAFGAGERRDAQHEYLEWHVHRTAELISRVVFVTETPEYWTLLARHEPDRVLELYREMVDPAVERRDLFPDGETYDPRNKWNSANGIVHYIMNINSMFDLLGVSQEREPSRKAKDNYDGLPYSRATAADARLNMDLWALSRKGFSLATDEPIGIYMIDWDDTGWTKPDGSPVGDYWRVVRGIPGAALRLEYEVPTTEEFSVGDILIGGRPIVTGGQIAEHIVLSARGIVGQRDA